MRYQRPKWDGKGPSWLGFLWYFWHPWSWHFGVTGHLLGPVTKAQLLIWIKILQRMCSVSILSNVHLARAVSRSQPAGDHSFSHLIHRHFLQASSTSKLYNLLWRLLATWQWATCDCLCLLWRPKTSTPQHHLLWRDPGQRCCNICSLRQGLEHSTLPWHCPRQPMDGRALQDSLCIWPAWPLSCQPASPAPPQQCCQHVPNALDTSVNRLDKPWSNTCSSKESWSYGWHCPGRIVLSLNVATFKLG